MFTISAMRMAAAAFVVAVTALSSTAANANLIQNGDFSTGDLTDWTLFTTTATSTTANGNSGSSVSPTLPDVTSFDVTGNGSSLAAQFNVGSATIFVEGGAGIYQNVTTTAGVATFSGSFASSCANCSNDINADGGTFTVLLDGLAMDSYAVGSTYYTADHTALRSSLSFTADVSAGSHTVELLIARRFTNSSYSPYEYLDDISLNVAPTPVPESASLPLFATGLGAIGLLGCRKKRTNAAIAAA